MAHNRLTFPLEGCLLLAEHVRNAPKQATLYGKVTELCLWLVGDQGVYLMSPGRPHLPKEDNPEHHHVIYAVECDPDTMEFDDWWINKQNSFGGDDGCETIPLSLFDGAPPRGFFYVDFSETHLVFGVQEIE
jgi:hypothetical protein